MTKKELQREVLIDIPKGRLKSCGINFGEKMEYVSVTVFTQYNNESYLYADCDNEIGRGVEDFKMIFEYIYGMEL